MSCRVITVLTGCPISVLVKVFLLHFEHLQAPFVRFHTLMNPFGASSIVSTRTFALTQFFALMCSSARHFTLIAFSRAIALERTANLLLVHSDAVACLATLLPWAIPQHSYYFVILNHYFSSRKVPGSFHNLLTSQSFFVSLIIIIIIKFKN